MNRIRVLIGDDMPRMLRDIVEGVLGREPDMELIRAADARDLAAAIHAQQPDVVVAAERWASAHLPRPELVADNRQLAVLVVTGDGRAAHVMEMRRVPVDDLSPARLLETIRTACAPRTVPALHPGE